MKTILRLAILIIALPLHGQLSGTVTINAGAPVSATNFTSFASLAAGLNSSGISGPLVVNVMPNNSVFTEQFSLAQINGVSPADTITINGNGCTIYYAPASNSVSLHTVKLDGSDHIKIRNLIIRGGSVFSEPLVLVNGADKNDFYQCHITNDTSQKNSSPWCIQLGRPANPTILVPGGSGNRFRKCSTFGGSGAICIVSDFQQPTNNNVLEMCSFSDFAGTGVYLRGQLNASVKQCTIEQPSGINQNIVWGLNVLECGGLLCEGNAIKNLHIKPSHPVAFSSIHSVRAGQTIPGSAPNVFRNNILSCQGSFGIVTGFEIQEMDAHLYHNTILMNDTVSGTSIGIKLSGMNDSIRVFNNLILLQGQGSGKKYGFHYQCPTNRFASGNNLVYLDTLGTAATCVASYCGDKTFTQLQAAGLEINSLGSDPMIVMQNGCQPVPTNLAIDNFGLPLGVLVDANLVVRSNTAPDIGALEFGSLTDIKEFKRSMIQVYPNPAKEKVTVIFRAFQNYYLVVFDSFGKEVAHCTGSGTQSHLNMKGLRPGIYVVRELNTCLSAKVVVN